MQIYVNPLNKKPFKRSYLFALRNESYNINNSKFQVIRFGKFIIGTSSNECDTITGRQCLASYFFLKDRFEDVVLYLRTIKEFLAEDDDFNWNFGLALAKLEKYEEAEEHLLLIKNSDYKEEYLYNAWLAKCYIANAKAEEAWNLYLDMNTSNETLNLLDLIGMSGFQRLFWNIYW